MNKMNFLVIVNETHMVFSDDKLISLLPKYYTLITFFNINHYTLFFLVTRLLPYLKVPYHYFISKYYPTVTLLIPNRKVPPNVL